MAETLSCCTHHEVTPALVLWRLCHVYQCNRPAATPISAASPHPPAAVMQPMGGQVRFFVFGLDPRDFGTDFEGQR